MNYKEAKPNLKAKQRAIKNQENTKNQQLEKALYRD